MLEGITIAMLTPFERSGALSEKGVRALAGWLAGKGINGLYVCGTAGEGLLMSLAERQRVAEIAVDEVGDRVHVVVHVGALSTADAVTLARHAQSVGARGAGIVAPPFYPVDKRCMVEHFVQIACAVPDFPIYLYNLPEMARNDIAPEVLGEVCRSAPNVAGIKDSSRKVERLTEYRQVAPAGFEIIVGSDGILLDGLLAGAIGGISALGSVFPEPLVKVYQAYQSQALEAARTQQKLIGQLRDAVKSGPYLAAYKEALRQRGLPAGYPRRPLRPLSPEEELYVSGLLAPLLPQL